MMIDRRGGVGLVVFVLLCLCLIVVVFVVILIKGNDEVRVPSGENVSVVFFNVSVGSNAVGRVDYVLRNESSVFVRGSLFSGVLEFYRGGVPNGSNVYLSAWSDSYYWNEVVCNVSFNDFPCNVSLKLKASNYSVGFNGSVLVLDTGGFGVLQSPLICVSERANVKNVILNLNSAPVPVDLKKSFDFCYKIERDVIGRREFLVDVHKNEFYNVSDVLVFLVRDYEKDSFKNVGDERVGLIV